MLPKKLVITLLVFASVSGVAQKPIASKTAAQKNVSSATNERADLLMDVISQELNRATMELSKVENAPYFTSYSVDDVEEMVIIGSNGAILISSHPHRRTADVSVRVGSPAFDNTHAEGRRSGLTSGLLPLTDDRDAISRELWRLTDREFKQAAQVYLRLKTEQAVRAKEEDDSPDFSQETFRSQAQKPATTALSVDQKDWETKLRRLSLEFNKYPLVYRSGVFLSASVQRHRFISSEKIE